MSRRFSCADPDQRSAGLLAAQAAIRRGALVVFPADTFYVVAGDAFRPDTSATIRTVKGREPQAALPIFVGSSFTADGIVRGLTACARDLMSYFWPGPLTIIADPHMSLAWDVGPYVGVRMPLHPVALQLVRETGPVTAPAANFSGMPNPVTCDEAHAQLGDSVAVYLDAGELSGGPGSAVVDIRSDPPAITRTGVVTTAELLSVCPDLSVVEPE